MPQSSEEVSREVNRAMGQPMLFEDRKGYRIAKEMVVEALRFGSRPP